MKNSTARVHLAPCIAFQQCSKTFDKYTQTS